MKQHLQSVSDVVSLDRKKPFVKSSLRIDVFLVAKNPRFRSMMTMDLWK